MKVIHIGTNDEGGAYQAMVRISQSMESCGAECRILLRNKENPNNPGETVCKGIQRLISKAKNFLNLCMSFGTVQSDYFGENLANYPAVQEADVIFLHWTNSFVSYNTIRNLAKLKKSVIWVMHDMWLITGGCHIDGYCRGYERSCKKCPQTHSILKKRIAAESFKRKKQALSELKPSVVTPSHWLKELAEKSDITRGLSIQVIPNPINTDIFFPCSEENHLKVREELGIKLNEKVILFSAYQPTKNENKGFRYLREALKLIEEEGYVLLICGNDKDEEKYHRIGKVRIIFLGRTNDSHRMKEYYNIADTTVVTSMQESFSYSTAESLACGTPVTAFKVCGLPDLIRDRKNGFFAEYGDVVQLKEGILFCCANKSKMTGQVNAIQQQTNYGWRIGERYLEVCNKVKK